MTLLLLHRWKSSDSGQGPVAHVYKYDNELWVLHTTGNSFTIK